MYLHQMQPHVVFRMQRRPEAWIYWQLPVAGLFAIMIDHDDDNDDEFYHDNDDGGDNDDGECDTDSSVLRARLHHHDSWYYHG